jgi:hypothetical protein
MKIKAGATAKGVRTASAAGIAKLLSGFPLVLLALAAWAVAIAGVSVVRHEAGSNDIYGGIEFTWFVIFGTIFVLLAALVQLIGISVDLLPIGHAAIASLLAVMTTLNMLETNRWNQARKSTPYSDSRLGKGAVTAFAGFISVSVLSALLIIALGNSAELRHSRKEEVHVAPTHTTQIHHNPVGTTPVATAV